MCSGQDRPNSDRLRTTWDVVRIIELIQVPISCQNTIKTCQQSRKGIGEKPVQPQCKPNQDDPRPATWRSVVGTAQATRLCVRQTWGIEEDLTYVASCQTHVHKIKLPCTRARLHVHDVIASESDQLGEP